MEDVSVRFGPPGQAVFSITDSNGTQLAKLNGDIYGNDLLVYGMETLKGKRSLASKLFTAIISYARENYLKVIASNSFVYNKLIQHPERFADVWDENSHYDE